MKHLTMFQVRCMKELKKRLRAAGLSLNNVVIRESDEEWYAEKEIFIEASAGHLNVWIYEDGAHIRGRNINVSFEAPDYKTEEDLMHAFIEDVASLIDDYNTSNFHDK